jgi:hypothetical protein
MNPSELSDRQSSPTSSDSLGTNKTQREKRRRQRRRAEAAQAAVTATRSNILPASGSNVSKTTKAVPVTNLQSIATAFIPSTLQAAPTFRAMINQQSQRVAATTVMPASVTSQQPAAVAPIISFRLPGAVSYNQTERVPPISGSAAAVSQRLETEAASRSEPSRRPRIDSAQYHDHPKPRSPSPLDDRRHLVHAYHERDYTALRRHVSVAHPPMALSHVAPFRSGHDHYYEYPAQPPAARYTPHVLYDEYGNEYVRTAPREPNPYVLYAPPPARGN